MTAPEEPETTGEFTSAVAYSARVNNYWQGGKDHFATDRQAAEQAVDAFPGLPAAVKTGAAFRQRVIRYLVSDGVRQFLDLGCGLPAGDPPHAMAQALDPGCHVCYVDDDPMAITHAQALYASAPEGRVGFVQADVRDTAQVLDAAAGTLDFDQPTAVFMVSLLHLIPDDTQARRLVAAVLDETAPGSYLVLVHPASDIRPEASGKMQSRLNDLVAQQRKYRDHTQVSAFFDGLTLVEPGVVQPPAWRPYGADDAKTPTIAWAGVARKP
jgi:SAM-dependent methyltransferase